MNLLVFLGFFFLVTFCLANDLELLDESRHPFTVLPPDIQYRIYQNFFDDPETSLSILKVDTQFRQSFTKAYHRELCESARSGSTNVHILNRLQKLAQVDVNFFIDLMLTVCVSTGDSQLWQSPISLAMNSQNIGFLKAALIAANETECPFRHFKGLDKFVEPLVTGYPKNLYGINCQDVKNMKLPGGQRLLHFAALNGYVLFMEMLLEAGANVDFLDMIGRTPIFEAIMGENDRQVQRLLRRGAIINIQDLFGLTPVQFAVSRCNIRSIQLLFNQPGIILNPIHATGFSLVHFSVRSGCVRTVQTVVNHPDVFIETRTSSGDTALHLACDYGFYNIAEYLLETMSADAVNSRNMKGKTAYRIATENGFTDIASLIRKSSKFRFWHLFL